MAQIKAEDKTMTRRELISELLERLEAELDELDNKQLKQLVEDYEHAPLLEDVILTLDDAGENDEAEPEAPLMDDEWKENEDD